MRFLNKIIFINSAHVRYAEIGLNGNVHLIGTQGVGKSTLLRALLFFYNADKQKLGIPREKKSFDDFYFEHANSYIVYEVARDESAFCVLLSKRKGRACFNFIDAPYNKDWIVDQNGEVTAELKIIRSRLDNVPMSSTVEKYEQYRDIIYGNRQSGISKEFYKYNVAESSKYQNIPRSIQNVFLNSKLDADFIKDTIIQSMDGESSFIDLNYFRSQVSEFEQEYHDIELWFEKNKRGECETRADADVVVKYYRALLQLRHELEICCKELNYSYRNTSEQLPSVERDIEKTDGALQSTITLIDGESVCYNKERDSLKEELTRVKNNLEKCKEYKNYYASINIAEVLRKDEQESSLKITLESLEEKKRVLMREYESVDEKYQALLAKIQNALIEFVQIQKENINQRKSQVNADVQNLMNQLEDKRLEATKSFEDEFSAIDIQQKSLSEEKHSCEKELVRLKYFHPLERDIEDCRNRISDLDKELSAKKQQKSEYRIELNKLLSEKEKETENNKLIYSGVCDELDAGRSKLLEQKNRLDDLLDRQKGSLYEWLVNNKPGWENNIGKVVDEETVLYNTELSPSLDESMSLFGVSLDLNEMPIRVRTPEEISEERKNIEQELENIKKKLADANTDFENKNSSIERSYGTKIRKIQEDIQLIDVEIEQHPIRSKRLKNELEFLRQKDIDEIEKLRNEVNNQLNKISQKIIEAEEKAKRVREKRDHELSKLNENFQERKKELNALFEEFEVDALAEIKAQENRASEESEELKRQRDAELSSKNVDISAVNNCENEIKQIKGELEKIAKNKDVIAVFKNRKDEFLDHEVEFIEKNDDLIQKLSSLKNKFDERWKTLSQLKTTQTEKLQFLRKQADFMKNCISEADRFKVSELCPAILQSVGEQSNAKNCQDIIVEIRENLFAEEKRHKDLHVAVDKFRKRFSSRNTFKFRTELNVESDYMDFAENLSDFIVNDKIKDYRDRTSGRYTDILERVAKEIGDVIKQKTEVEKIIHSVNRDFVEKNFAGVIKSISLRMEESEDKLMRLLSRIKTFHDENRYRMGNLPLFSDGETGNIDREVVKLLLAFVRELNDDSTRNNLKLSDAFKLQFRVVENDNDTGWTDKLSNVGSEGTDVLVKAMVNIMLINVFKTQVSRKFGDFKLHCMMDEIGRLHPKNANGILQFANSRNIYLVNGSPTTQSVSEYRYTYLLEKNSKSETVVRKLMTKV